ncbi:zinc-binding dehydrogenase [Actinoplanes couchii]|uniref:Quinone oxidoreductase n=1 Tax=Actinoplanes couchii TaxID=403638 RepID=A0ABQ3WZ99_9ACTN|nr:zinc-binding dehydrogenase [Actinoplanes couchii]MDR6315997.1 NADPH2:quinone reductase [Actinoplanes couchii]GID51610.1 quinone oxidoreductase [Actinoplanes couchii]
MKAVVIARYGGPEALEHRTVPDPVPGDDDVLVQASAIGVNYHDVYNRNGTYAVPLPFVPGRELAGTVIAVGAKVEGYTVGDRVATVDVPSPGAYAERVVVPACRVVPVPPTVSLETAAAVLLQGLTADYLSRITFPVQPGDVAVVHAAGGGTGVLLTQMIRARGGRVVATISDPAKIDLVREMGAEEVICRNETDFDKEVHRITDGAGAAVVYDSIGRDTFEQSLASLSRRGHLVLYGKSGGLINNCDLHSLGPLGSLTVHVPMLPDFIASPHELTAGAAALFDLVLRGVLRLHIGGRFPLAEARAAHAALESRRSTGKLLLTVSDGAENAAERPMKELFDVLVDSEGRHSLWPKATEAPWGWTRTAEVIDRTDLRIIAMAARRVGAGR